MRRPWPIPFALLVDHVIDGDTIAGTFTADAGLDLAIILRGWRLRFYSLDTEELTDPDPERRARALAAKEYLASRVPAGVTLQVDSYSFDNYGRRIDGVPWLGALDLQADMLTRGYQKAPR